MKNCRETEEAAKDFLILEKKRPIEVDKLDIKACFQQQLLYHDFKKFQAKFFGEDGDGRFGGITFDFLRQV